MSGGIPLGRWSSAEFRSSSTEEFGTQFYPDSGQQAFCSPTTPGPSPQYPHTPTMSSPGTQVHPRNERQAFHTQPSTQTFSCLPDSDSFPLSSEPGPHLLPGHTEPMLDLTGFFNAVGDLDTSFPPQEGGQNVNSSAQAPSLPAGPAWAAKCGGGSSTGGDVQLDRTWMKRPQPANRAKVLDCRLLCTMCKRDFRSLPALNGHMRSHSGFRSAKCLKKDEDAAAAPPTVSMVMPVSVPIRSRGASRALRMGQRRCTHRSPAVGGAVLYHSLMHLDGDAAVAEGGDEEAAVDGGRGHYTPPPMLCPVRVGTGLYCSLTTWRKHRVQTVHLHNTAHNGLGDHVAMETLTTGTMKPQINVGRGFQAEIPPLRNHKQAHADSQNALQMWTPWYEVEKPVNQPRVDALLMMVRTCVVPGGGASPEHALRVLSECRGDFLLTAEKLLSSPDTSNNNHTGVSWSAAEIRLLVKSLQLHHKDFGSVQRAVQTKSLSQCVEFYYLMKKKLNLGVRTSARLTITLPDTNRPPRCPDTM
ncbi:uncharacterized protein LOC115054042 [Echeneis naucrates]|uniref:uncharacterized protein LOC115054042 n=1 Tax=Echeneis naucrates TaxID=173247 RepID=UPI001113F162|nr:uncharacterized protein LOC115054042 [Echeneis naucrates]